MEVTPQVSHARDLGAEMTADGHNLNLEVIKNALNWHVHTSLCTSSSSYYHTSLLAGRNLHLLERVGRRGAR